MDQLFVGLRNRPVLKSTCAHIEQSIYYLLLYIYPHSSVESENIVLINAWMVFPTIHMSLHYDCYDTYL